MAAVVPGSQNGRDSMTTIQCLECGQELKRVTNTHLAQHNMTMLQYMDKYPSAPIDAPGLAMDRVAHLRGKTYEQVYGEGKAAELKKVRSEDAVTQFEDEAQRQIRRETIMPSPSEEQRMAQREAMERHGGSNYRKRALEYYGAECSRCGCTPGEDKLVVHHIDGNNVQSEMGNHELENLMVLCHGCHRKVHAEMAKVSKRMAGMSHVERGMHYILKGLKQDFGLDLTDVNFKDTPKRVARAYYEIFEGVRDTKKQVEEVLSSRFPFAEHDLVVANDITVYSMCPHHFLPVEYKVHVGYVPNGFALGISKLSRLAEILAARPVLQETFTREVVDALEEIGAVGAMCVAEGRHFCMIMRGVRQPSSVTVTSAVRGVFATDPKSRAEFLRLIGK